jgi:outer membrane protein
MHPVKTHSKGPCKMRQTSLGIKKLLCFLPLLWGIHSGPLAAEEVSTPSPLTLQDAIALGIQKSPRLSSARFQMDASAARVSAARSALFPRIDFTESFVQTNNPAQAFSLKLNQERITLPDFDPARLNDPSSIRNFGSTFSFSMPLYDAGQFRIGVNQAKLGEASASLSAERVRQEVIAGVVAAYVGVLLAQSQLQVVHQALETARAHYSMVRSRHQSGLVVRSDLLRAEVRIAELEQERLNASSQIEVARAALNVAMGLETDRSFQLAPLDESRSGPPGSPETWVQESLQNRADLRQLRFQEMAAEEEVSKAKMAHLPGLYLTGNYELDSEDFGRTGNNYTVGVALRANLFAGFGMEAKVHEALANLQQVKAMVRQFELSVGLETRRSFSLNQSAVERIKVAEAAVAQADEGLRIVRNRYESGLFTIVNLLDAEVALQQAKVNHLRSLYDCRVARVQLYLAAGKMGELYP